MPAAAEPRRLPSEWKDYAQKYLKMQFVYSLFSVPWFPGQKWELETDNPYSLFVFVFFNFDITDVPSSPQKKKIHHASPNSQHIPTTPTKAPLKALSTPSTKLPPSTVPPPPVRAEAKDKAHAPEYLGLALSAVNPQ